MRVALVECPGASAFDRRWVPVTALWDGLLFGGTSMAMERWERRYSGHVHGQMGLLGWDFRQLCMGIERTSSFVRD